jgi:hypothetical protein
MKALGNWQMDGVTGPHELDRTSNINGKTGKQLEATQKQAGRRQPRWVAQRGQSDPLFIA